MIKAKAMKYVSALSFRRRKTGSGRLAPGLDWEEEKKGGVPTEGLAPASAVPAGQPLPPVSAEIPLPVEALLPAEAEAETAGLGNGGGDGGGGGIGGGGDGGGGDGGSRDGGGGDGGGDGGGGDGGGGDGGGSMQPSELDCGHPRSSGSPGVAGEGVGDEQDRGICPREREGYAETPLHLPLQCHLALHLPGPPPLRCPALSLCGTAYYSSGADGPVRLALGRLPLLDRLQASHLARAGAASLVHADVS